MKCTTPSLLNDIKDVRGERVMRVVPCMQGPPQWTLSKVVLDPKDMGGLEAHGSCPGSPSHAQHAAMDGRYRPDVTDQLHPSTIYL